MKKVYIVNGSSAYSELFSEMGFAITLSISEANLICFTGGADVSPSIYGDDMHRTTYSSYQRDVEESEIFRKVLSLNIPMVGICRGGQFLNVMSGGRMYQDVTKHACHEGHSITDLGTGEIIYVSSTHHQMIMRSSRGLLVASSTLGGTREWYDGEVFKKDVSNEDQEVVYYNHTNSLCFQPHPEFNSSEYVGMRRYFKSLLERFFV